jgi:tripartite-type tricarboxylate transporter receptor subunit TctC
MSERDSHGCCLRFRERLLGIDPAAAQNYPRRTVTIIVPFRLEA